MAEATEQLFFRGDVNWLTEARAQELAAEYAPAVAVLQDGGPHWRVVCLSEKALYTGQKPCRLGDAIPTRKAA